MEFKGTHEKWERYAPNHIGCEKVSFGKQTGFHGYIEIWHHHFKNKEEAIANALLISKAPEMLEILNELSKSIHFLNSNNLHLTRDKIEALIKEATELK